MHPWLTAMAAFCSLALKSDFNPGVRMEITSVASKLPHHRSRVVGLAAAGSCMIDGHDDQIPD